MSSRSSLLDPGNKVGVVSLDYSNCGGYLSSVYENGLINIYGLTTKIKSDSITLDRDSSLARFHPAKRFHIAVVSFKGSVTVYDIAAKKIHFQQKEAHDAPCRDVAMPANIPDRLLTCGCDSVIKIFDTRKKATGLKIQSYCGFSTISVTDCGGFFAVGNLKGDLLTYDMRNLGQPLGKMKVDNDLVTRVSFLPSWDDNVTAMSHRYSSASTVNEDLPEPPEETSDYTMEDIIGFQKGRISELDISVTSRVSTFSVSERRASENFGRNMANALNDLSFTSDTSLQDGNAEVVEADSKKVDTSKRFTPGKKDSINKRRTSMLTSGLQLIHEEHADKENFNVCLNQLSTPTLTPHGPPRFSSTPATVVKTNPQKAVDESIETIDVEALASPSKDVTDKKQEAASMQAAPSVVVAPCDIDFKQEFQKLHEKIRTETQSLDFDASARHWEMTFLVSNKTRQLQERVQMIEECMGILMNDDFKINRIMELEAENQALRRNLDEVNRRLQL